MPNKIFQSNLKIIGETTILHLRNGKPIKVFNSNKLWKFIKKHFNLDLKIPFLLGNWTDQGIRLNTVTTVGKALVAQLIGGISSTYVRAIALGIGTPSTTALGSEITTGGGGRGAATISNETTDLTNDTCQFVKTFTFSSNYAVTEEGLFNNSTSGGVMFASQSFSAIDVVDTDQIQIIHKAKVA